MPRTVKRLFTVAIAVLLLIGAYYFITGVLAQKGTVPAYTQAGGADGRFLFEVIDCGQADSLIALTPEGHTLLIDAGADRDADAVIAELKGHNIDRIDLLVVTHPHADHIGGMREVVENYEVEEALLPETESQNSAYNKLKQDIEHKGIRVNEADPSDSYTFGALNVRVMGPVKYYDNANDISTVLKLTYGDMRFLLMGDAEKKAEKDMLAEYSAQDLKADVLKAGHHGSRTSTSEAFLKAVRPSYAAISAGKNNDYGHPHPEITDRLKKYRVAVYRTDESGNLLFYTDGEAVEVATGH